MTTQTKKPGLSKKHAIHGENLDKIGKTHRLSDRNDLMVDRQTIERLSD